MILFILAVIGLTHIMVDSEIMEPVEEWAKDWMPFYMHHAIFNCYQCSGFWCGLSLSPLVSWNPFVMLACGYAGSFIADFSETLFRYMETKNAS